MMRTPAKPRRWATVLLCVLTTCSAVTSANADDRRDNLQMIRLVRPVAESVKVSVAQVICGGSPVSLGTVVREDGYVLTKRSQLTGGDPVRVRLADGRMFPARVAAVRRQNDLALLKVEADTSFVPIRFADQRPPIASFVISAGRSGRPVGIGVVGVKARPVSHRGRLGVMLGSDPDGRAIVDDVFVGSGADQAGIVPGDLIVAINGREENSRVGVINTLRQMFPGESVRLTIRRPTDSSDWQTLEMDARIRELGVLQESESDSKVNGRRNIRLSGFDEVIQHDTVLDPDFCGGPVLDTSGRVVGINIARAGRVVTYALPSSLVQQLLNDMMQEVQ